MPLFALQMAFSYLHNNKKINVLFSCTFVYNQLTLVHVQKWWSGDITITSMWSQSVHAKSSREETRTMFKTSLHLKFTLG